MDGLVTHSSEDGLRDQALTSWKEIAQYLSRGIRTVQRWEAELGLPVHRRDGKKRGCVVALRSELDAWLKACPFNEQGVLQPGNPQLQQIEIDLPNTQPATSSPVVLESRLLRQSLGRARKGLSEAVKGMTESCRRLEPGTSMAAEERRLWSTVQDDSGACPRVLVIDDNEIQAYTMRKTLNLAGFTVICADSGTQGLAMTKEARPDAIVLDLNMPDLNGFEVCSRIKKDAEISDIPVIFYTSGGPAGKDYAKSMGAAAFLTYPIDPSHLTLVLQVSIARGGHWNVGGADSSQA